METEHKAQPPMDDIVAAANFAEVRRRLRQQLAETISPLLQRVTRVALLEFPPHANVGDSAIWLGAVEYLRQQHRLRPVVTSDIYNYAKAPLQSAIDGGVILINGGGNLGDVWQAGLDSKIQVLQDFPNTPIVQLPQTMHFREAGNLQAYRSAVSRHRAFTLLVRDQPSFDLARENLDCQVQLCPDMALWLHLQRAQTPRHDVLCLLRKDIEASGAGRASMAEAVDGCVVADWLNEPPDIVIRAERAMTSIVSLYSRRLTFLRSPLNRIRDRVAWHRLRRGCALLSSGRVVVTDRLHGHILCVLMGIPHVLLDNSYGKLRRFYDSWTSGCADARFATSIEEALDIARELARTH